MVIIMKKVMLTTAIAATVLSLSATTYANEAPKEMEKCVTKAGEMEVPAGECEKVNKGDFSGVSEEVKAKVEAAH